VTASLGSFVLITGTTPIWVLCVVYFVMGAGMASVMAPVTEVVMSTLPRERAGVGSAVTNTVRQVGGALGVAVLGSVLSEVYRNGMHGPLSGFPAAVRDVASESLASTYAVAADSGRAGAALIVPANDAFVNAMHWAAGGSAIAAVLGALAVVRWLPGRTVPEVRTLTPAEAEASLVDAT
jgi:MFS family permease